MIHVGITYALCPRCFYLCLTDSFGCGHNIPCFSISCVLCRLLVTGVRYMALNSMGIMKRDSGPMIRLNIHTVPLVLRSPVGDRNAYAPLVSPTSASSEPPGYSLAVLEYPTTRHISDAIVERLGTRLEFEASQRPERPGQDSVPSSAVITM